MTLDEARQRPPDSDDRLLVAYAAGDPSAPRAMTDRFTAPAFRLAVRMLADRTEAEDVTQEALIRLFRAAPGWQPGGARVTSWLYRVTANLCTDRLRQRRPEPLDEAPEVADAGAAPEDRLTDKARSDALALALSDRAYLLERGKVVLTGPAAALSQDAVVRTTYLGVGKVKV